MLITLLSLQANALTLQHTPLRVGQPATFVATGATPGATVGFVYSLSGEGAGPCPPVLGGACLGILNPTLAGTAVANGLGVAVFQAPIPAGAPLVDVALQAAEVGANPGVSSPVTSPLLGVLAGDAILGLTHTTAELRHLWRIDGTLSAAAAPSLALSLPDLEALGRLDLLGLAGSVDVDLPALTELGSVSLASLGATTLNLPVLETWIDDPVAPSRAALDVSGVASLTVVAPAVTDAGFFRVSSQGPVALQLPAVERLTSLQITAANGLSLAMDALLTLGGPIPTALIGSQPDLVFSNLRGVPALDVLPSLQSVEGAIYLTDNGVDLVSVPRIGSSTLTVAGAGGWGLGMWRNTGLVSVAAFPATTQFGGYVQVRDNNALPSCEAEALVLRISAPPNISCYRNVADACVGAVCF